MADADAYLFGIVGRTLSYCYLGELLTPSIFREGVAIRFSRRNVMASFCEHEDVEPLLIT
jgi:hypothetical protein